MSLLLTIILITQTSSFKESHSPQVVEIGFQVAQEDFIISENSYKYPDELFTHLGSSNWKIREAANKRLFNYFSVEPKEVRWLFWGVISRDQEIRYRCNRILRLLNTCECCEGKGKYIKGEYNTTYEADCDTCDGIGNFWELYLWR